MGCFQKMPFPRQKSFRTEPLSPFLTFFFTVSNKLTSLCLRPLTLSEFVQGVGMDFSGHPQCKRKIMLYPAMKFL